MFVDKSLDMMLAEIGPIITTIEDSTGTDWEDDIFGYLLDGDNGYKSLVRKFVPDGINRETLLDDPFSDQTDQPLVEFMIGNAYYRGYGWKPGGDIKIKYYFGENGLVFRVSDDGVGFDSEELIRAAENNELKRGIHFSFLGTGTAFLRLPHYEASIISSEVKPTGTTVTVMFKYDQDLWSINGLND